MENMKFDKEKLVNYWIAGSDDDFETMITLYESGRYSWCLFVGHLMIEKLLKAYFVVVNSDFPPYIHNLLRLAEKSEIVLDEEKKLFLVTVTAFNINSRYDDYKMSFQKKCTPEFTKEWVTKIKDKRTWIKELIKQ